MTASMSSRPVLPQEPLFVFGSNIAGEHTEGDAAIAARFHGAESGTWNGPAGNSYALPYLGSGLRLLPLEVIADYVGTCCEYMVNKPDVTFQVARFACGQGEYRDAETADLWRYAPGNCRLPGLWLRTLDPRRAVRLLVLDPHETLSQASQQALMERFLAGKAARWQTPQVEFVSVGALPGIGATAQFARRLDCRHRVIGHNPAYYGDHAAVMCERQAVWYATHLIDLVDADNSDRPEHVRVLGNARHGGLAIHRLVA